MSIVTTITWWNNCRDSASKASESKRVTWAPWRRS